MSSLCHELIGQIKRLNNLINEFDLIDSSYQIDPASKVGKLAEIQTKLASVERENYGFEDFFEKLTDQEMWKKFESILEHGHTIRGISSTKSFLSDSSPFEYLQVELEKKLPKESMSEAKYRLFLKGIAQHPTLAEQFDGYAEKYNFGISQYYDGGLFFGYLNSIILQQMAKQGEKIILKKPIPTEFADYFGIFLYKARIEAKEVGNYAFSNAIECDIKLGTAGEGLGFELESLSRIEVDKCGRQLGFRAKGGKFVAKSCGGEVGKLAEPSCSFIVGDAGERLGELGSAAMFCQNAGAECLSGSNVTAFVERLDSTYLTDYSGKGTLLYRKMPDERKYPIQRLYQVKDQGIYHRADLTYPEKMIHTNNLLVQFQDNESGLTIVENYKYFSDTILCHRMKGGILVLCGIPKKNKIFNFSNLTIGKKPAKPEYRLGLGMIGGILLIDDMDATVEDVYRLIDHERKGGMILMRLYEKKADGNIVDQVVDVEEEFRRKNQL
jgi:hypothetical protein